VIQFLAEEFNEPNLAHIVREFSYDGLGDWE